MSDLVSRNRRRSEAHAGQHGFSFVEMMVALSVFTILLLVLSMATETFGGGAKLQRRKLSAHLQGERTLKSIEGEILGSSTMRDHPEPAGLILPLSATTPDYEVNEAYNWPPVPVGTLHATTSRDGFEYWHDQTSDRRFYIYATYQQFDTLELQRVQSPKDSAGMTVLLGTNDNIRTPWSTVRKIFVENGRAILRIRQPIGSAVPFQDVILGHNVESLSFHLDNRGQIKIRVVTVEPSRDGGSDIREVKELDVAPRNGLG